MVDDKNWDTKQKALALKPVSRQVQQSIAARMSEEEKLVAVLLEAPAASLPRKLKFWSPLNKRELDSELMSAFPFIWGLS